MDTSLDTSPTAWGHETTERRRGEVSRSRASYAYDELKRRLLVGEFPLTRRLGEVALAEALGVSRIPVREALSRLHAEGLVVPMGDG
ncbi:MAG: GntR family transcriptional regulator, partial [Actinomycetota bacterium]|nr:GntR family transcriptional regulator [Actinomycetota bacterium]